jgi:single-strand DNA-binding protein
MLNKIILIGRLVRDPESRHTPQGTPVCRFTLAVNRPFTNSEGEREADFIDCIAWEKLAENVQKYTNKGRLVAVEGRLQIRSYDDSQGVRRRAAEVICQRVVFMPDGKGKEGKGGIEPPPWPEEEPQYTRKQKTGGADFDDLDSFGGDEVPFNEDDIPF